MREKMSPAIKYKVNNKADDAVGQCEQREEQSVKPVQKLLAGAVSAVLIGVYGMPARAKDDSVLDLGVKRTRYQLDASNIALPDKADGTEFYVSFKVGEKWRVNLAYTDVDGEEVQSITTVQRGGYASGVSLTNPSPPPATFPANVWFNYNDSVVNEGDMDFELIDFTAEYDLALGGNFDMTLEGGLRYMDLSAEAAASQLQFLSDYEFEVPALMISRTPMPAQFWSDVGALYPAYYPAQQTGLVIGSQTYDALGARVGVNMEWAFNSNWSLGTDFAFDLLSGDREYTYNNNGVVTTGSSSESLEALEADIAIHWLMTPADTDEIGLELVMGYNFYRMYDLLLNPATRQTSHVDASGPYIELKALF